MSKIVYDDRFFDAIDNGAIVSAHHIYKTLFKYYSPDSMLDVGSGRGAWSKAFFDITKSKNFYAIDGTYVDKKKLLIPVDNYIEYDLTKPLNLNKKFDLVICMEVAEHLPESCSVDLIRTLCLHSDVILFSAAIPGQRGTFHINEQYPEYWERKFNDNGYTCKDIIRDEIWENDLIEPWYRQNTLLFVKKSEIERYPLLNNFENHNSRLTQIHPKVLETNVLIGNKLDSIFELIKYKLYPLKIKLKNILK